MAAERDATSRLAHIQPVARLEPLPLFVDERQQHDGHVELLRGKRRKPVKLFFGRGVEDQQLAQGLQAVVLVGGARGLFHGGVGAVAMGAHCGGGEGGPLTPEACSVGVALGRPLRRRAAPPELVPGAAKLCVRAEARHQRRLRHVLA